MASGAPSCECGKHSLSRLSDSSAQHATARHSTAQHATAQHEQHSTNNAANSRQQRQPPRSRPGNEARQDWTHKLAMIPCKRWVTGKLGSCPFGRDCFYAHHDENGKDCKPLDKTRAELKQEINEAERRNSDNGNSWRRGGRSDIMGIWKTGKSGYYVKPILLIGGAFNRSAWAHFFCKVLLRGR